VRYTLIRLEGDVNSTWDRRVDSWTTECVLKYLPKSFSSFMDYETDLCTFHTPKQAPKYVLQNIATSVCWLVLPFAFLGSPISIYGYISVL
jgi:hypothetical protein